MAPDELNTPLGRKKGKKQGRRLPVSPPQLLAGVLSLCGLMVIGWALFANDPLGGQPTTVVSTAPALAAAAPAKAAAPAAANPGAVAKAAMPPPGSRTITIIDGSSGKHQDVIIPGNGGNQTPSPSIDKALLQKTHEGMIPKIGPDGTRAFTRYATASKIPANRKDAPRIAIIVGDLGISASATSAALAKLPPSVTFAFAPYGNHLETLAAQARSAGHELLLQVPMEPLDYPNNDPGPRTLLTSLSNADNIQRLHWLMARIQGYVGLASYMGARFTASTQAMTPVLREAAKRGLIYVDDGSSPSSVAGEIASTVNVPYARADSVLDSVPTPTDIAQALRRLEMTARANGTAVGYAAAEPSAVTAIDAWAKTVESRGFVLVPITAVTLKTKST
ncbi:MAG TPA: divergent polysaccharide deacetylase family protein [Pseudolabrys sp.]|nr:divergent polysaccharide deacetylase family protein [Pseudolabrys sp.]